jgi:hypothetical protein
MNSSVESLPVPTALGSSSVIAGAFRPMSAGGKLGEAFESSSAATLIIVAEGSLAGNNWLGPLTIGAAVLVTRLQGFLASGRTVCQEPSPGDLIAGLLLASVGKRCRKASLLVGRVWAPVALVLDQPT